LHLQNGVSRANVTAILALLGNELTSRSRSRRTAGSSPKPRPQAGEAAAHRQVSVVQRRQLDGALWFVGCIQLIAGERQLEQRAYRRVTA
jgi:hypothetical protein